MDRGKANGGFVGPLIQAKAVNRGTAPAIQTPAGVTVRFPHALTASVETYDFALRKTTESSLSGTNLLTMEKQGTFAGIITVKHLAQLALYGR